MFDALTSPRIATRYSFVVVPSDTVNVDASNKTDVADYNLLTQICSTTHKVDDNTAKFYAGDMNQDGALDGFDVIAHELYTNGELTFE